MMQQHLLRVIVAGLFSSLLAVFSSAGAEEPAFTENALVPARVEFAKATARAKADLVDELQKKADAAQKKGDLKALEKLQAEISAFERAGELPKSLSATLVRGYQTQLRTAQTQMEKTYAACVKQYTKDGKIELAKATQAELEQFKRAIVRPGDAVEFRGRYYKVFETHATWRDARQKCEGLGGRLAVIETAAENNFVAGLLEKSKVVEAWLGATDEKKEGQWVWITGQKMEYVNWAPKQPNNKGGGEHYLVIGLNPRGQWMDQPNKSVALKPGFVCQWD